MSIASMGPLMVSVAEKRSQLLEQQAAFERELYEVRMQEIFDLAKKKHLEHEQEKIEESQKKRGYWRLIPTAIGAVIGGIYGGPQGAIMGAKAGASTGKLIIPDKGQTFLESSTSIQDLLAVGQMGESTESYARKSAYPKGQTPDYYRALIQRANLPASSNMGGGMNMGGMMNMGGGGGLKGIPAMAGMFKG